MPNKAESVVPAAERGVAPSRPPGFLCHLCLGNTRAVGCDVFISAYTLFWIAQRSSSQQFRLFQCSDKLNGVETNCRSVDDLSHLACVFLGIY